MGALSLEARTRLPASRDQDGVSLGASDVPQASTQGYRSRNYRMKIISVFLLTSRKTYYEFTGAGLETEYSVEIPVMIAEKFEVWRDLLERGPELVIPLYVDKQTFYDFIELVYLITRISVDKTTDAVTEMVIKHGVLLSNYLLYEPVVKYYVDNIDSLTLSNRITMKLHDEFGLHDDRRKLDLQELKVMSLDSLTECQKLLVRRVQNTPEYEECILKCLLALNFWFYQFTR